MFHVLFQYQPKKKKTKRDTDFDDKFNFISNASDYTKDTWNDLQKYVKRKGTSKVDEKIERSREHIKIIVSSISSPTSYTGMGDVE